ncbi:uncharacterized protein LOC135143543 isoform X2 [Zophobas morio]|uniref:uncharacterized protein LOC135143543 isoform X2 n=1 Tax=Zophobas morio TaxID=2755281 RepID=UPI003083E039
MLFSCETALRLLHFVRTRLRFYQDAHLVALLMHSQTSGAFTPEKTSHRSEEADDKLQKFLWAREHADATHLRHRRGWDRPLPYLPTWRFLDEWQPSKRREVMSPVFALCCECVHCLDYGLFTFNALECCKLLYVKAAFTLCAFMLYRLQHTSLLLYFLIYGALTLVTLFCNIIDRFAPYEWLRPLWVYGVFMYSCVLLAIGNTISDNEEIIFPFHTAFIPLFSVSFAYILLSIMNPQIRYCTYKDVILGLSSWIRTKCGIMCTGAHIFIYTCLYLFSLTNGVWTLKPLCIVGLLVGVLIVPINFGFCLLVHLPISLLLISSSVHLSTLDQMYALDLLEKVISGPLLEQARLALDIHCTSGIAGLLSFLLWFWHVFTLLWTSYLTLRSRTARYAMALFIYFFHYFVAVVLLAVAEKETNSMLHFVQTLLAFGSFFVGLQPSLPFMLNIDCAKTVAKITLPIGNITNLLTGEVEFGAYMKDLKKRGLKQIKSHLKETSKSLQPRVERIGISATNQTPKAQKRKLFQKNPFPIFCWPPLALLTALRLDRIAPQNHISHLLTVVTAIVAVWALMVKTKSIWTGISACSACLLYAVLYESVLFTFVTSTLLYFLVWFYVRAAYPARGSFAVGIVTGVLIFAHMHYCLPPQKPSWWIFIQHMAKRHIPLLHLKEPTEGKRAIALLERVAAFYSST